MHIGDENETKHLPRPLNAIFEVLKTPFRNEDIGFNVYDNFQNSLPEKPILTIAEPIDLNYIINAEVDIATRVNVEVFCQRVQTTAHVVVTTVSPRKFFDNLNYLFDCLLYLMQYEKCINYQTPTPRQYYNSIVDGMETIVDEFIERSISFEKQKLSEINGSEQKYKHYESFLIALISAFDCAHTFWEGDKISPHYTGPLFTDRNYDRVKKLYDELDSIYDRYVMPLWTANSKLKTKGIDKLTYAEKELLAVNKISQSDMLQFPNMPYDLNCKIHKHIQAHSHAFAYMDLNSYNIKIAKEHLTLLNNLIDFYRQQIPLLTKDIFININEIAFRQYSERYGYTRLICEPYKFEGKISNFPLQLSFISRRDTDSITAGNICYSSDGVIQKAEVRIRKEYGWGFYFITENKQLILQKAESTLRPNKYGQPTTVYQDKSLIEYERARKLDLEKYEWIKANIPANCPKSFAGFRRMKNANSKNYQKIVAEAAALGKQI